jgi:replicative DNA helicase
MSGKIADENLAAEMGVCGAVTTDAERWMPVAKRAGITEEWFADAQARAVWSALERMWGRTRGKGVDQMTLWDELSRGDAKKEDAPPPDMGWVESMIERTFEAHCEYHIDILRNRHGSRKGRRLASEFARKLDAGAAAAIQDMSGRLLELLEEITRGGSGDDKDAVIDGVLAKFEEAHRTVMVEKRKYMPGLPLPWHHMTNIYSAMGPGMHIVSGRPSTGKTALINNFIRFWCGCLGMQGGLNSLDMARGEMWGRNFSELTRVSLPKAKFGNTSNEEMGRLREAAATLKGWKLDMRVCRDLDEFSSWVTLGVMKKGWKFCVVDFIQLLSFRDCYRMSVDDRTTQISGTVKGLGLDLGIPMVVLSQLNRDCEKEGGRVPKPSDLRGGGSLEQDAASVLMLSKDEACERAWREYPPKMLTPFGSNDAVQTYLAKRLRPVWARIEKNQQGSTGELPLVFYKNYFLFRLADYLAEPSKIEKGGRTVGWDYTPLFSRVHSDFRQHAEDAALRKSGGLVTEYEDGAE